jgi:hypothetical protein
LAIFPFKANGRINMSISRERIGAGLSELGFRRSVSQRSTEGEYEPFDADWNYKDIPHLSEVHAAVDGVVVNSETDHTSSVFLQKIGPIRVPLLVYIGTGKSNNAIYVGCVGPFVIVIETLWARIGEIRSRVVTTYEVFSPKIFILLHPLIHRLLSRNYDVLMTADLPMREQRGRLRKRGYRFVGDSSGYGFRESSNLSVRNIIAPPELRRGVVKVLLRDLPNGRSLHGGDTEVGLVIDREGTTLTIYPRICDHAGADLGCALKQVKGLRCPWHGRTVRPLATLDENSGEIVVFSGGVALQVEDGQLVVGRQLDG